MNTTGKCKSSSGNKRARILLAVLFGVLGVAVIVALFFLLGKPRDMVNQSLLSELARANIIYDGFCLEMDGSAEERFFLGEGFTDTETVSDLQTRDIKEKGVFHFIRWQMTDLSLTLHLLPFDNNETIVISLNGQQLDKRVLPVGYQDVTVELPGNAMVAGENTLELVFSGIANPGAAIDYIRFHTSKTGIKGLLEVDRRPDGNETVPVMGTSSTTEIDFYQEIPAGTHLKFGLGHDRHDTKGSPGKLTLWCQNEQGNSRLVWSGDFPDSGIKRVDVDLAEFAGTASVLSFMIVPNEGVEDWLFISQPCLAIPREKLPAAPHSPVLPQASTKHPRTIVLICEDALRRDFLPIYGHKVITTPNLDDIATKALVFENAYSSNSWTKPTFASLFTGQPAPRHGAFMRDVMMRDDVTTLAEILDKHRWRTALITANPYTSNHFGLQRGFADFFDLNPNPLYAKAQNIKASAEEFIPPLRSWLASLATGQDAFIVLHMMDVHAPYKPPVGYEGRYDSKKEGLLTQMPWLREQSKNLQSLSPESAKMLQDLLDYCCSISYFDEIIPDLTKLFSDFGRGQGTVFVFFSDHGDEMMDHGGVQHGQSLYNELIRVPLIIWGDGVTARRSSEYVNLIDLMPTVLNLAGIPTPEGIMGNSFAGLLSGEDRGMNLPQFSETALVTPEQLSVVYGDWKLIMRMEKSELYMVKDDPGETNNVILENPIRYGILRSLLIGWWKEASQGARIGRELVLDKQTNEMLKGLGYVQK